MQNKPSEGLSSLNFAFVSGGRIINCKQLERLNGKAIVNFLINHCLRLLILALLPQPSREHLQIQVVEHARGTHT